MKDMLLKIILLSAWKTQIIKFCIDADDSSSSSSSSVPMCWFSSSLGYGIRIKEGSFEFFLRGVAADVFGRNIDTIDKNTTKGKNKEEKNNDDDEKDDPNASNTNTGLPIAEILMLGTGSDAKEFKEIMEGKKLDSTIVRNNSKQEI